MNEQDLQEILKIILDCLQSKEFIWRIEGSANLKIQGIDVSIKDLDITTNNEGIGIFRDSLRKYVVKDFFSEKINGNSLICDINGFEIEINSHGDRKSNFFDKTAKVVWRNLGVNVLPLEYAKKFYETINRKDKVELIEKYLDDKN
jgi:hypothetical protein